MERNIKRYTLGVLFFLLILSLSGSVEGAVSEMIYSSAFILPSVVILFITCKGSSNIKLEKPKNITLLAPLTPLILLLIFSTAYLTALVIFITTGAQNEVAVTKDFTTDLFTLAIAPALFEELLFRYVPLKIIAPYSNKTALLVSSLFFALAHASLFSIPHAFIAGTVFMTVDIVSGSVIPSVILHLLNNLVSIGWEYAYPTGYAHVIPISLIALSLLSLIFISVKRKRGCAKRKNII